MVIAAHRHELAILSQHRTVIFANSALLECVSTRRKKSGFLQVTIMSRAISCHHSTVPYTAPSVELAEPIDRCRDIRLRTN